MIKWQLVAMATCQTLLRISVFELPESFILLKIIYIYIYIYADICKDLSKLFN